MSAMTAAADPFIQSGHSLTIASFMRRELLVTPRSFNCTLAVLAAVASAATSRSPSHAQPTTYDQQLSYYDPAVPYSAAPLSSSTYGSYSGSGDSSYMAGPSAGTNSGSVVYVGNYGVSDFNGTDSNNFFRLADDLNDNGGAIAIVQYGPNGQAQLTTMTDFADLHSFNVGFDEAGISRQTGFRTFDTGGVYWIRENGYVRPDSDEVVAEKTMTAIANLDFESPRVRRGTGSRVLFARTPMRSQLAPQFSRLTADPRRSAVGLVYGYYEHALLDRFRFDLNGSILGRAVSDTQAINWTTGPYYGWVAFNRFGPFTVYAHEFFVLGMNNGDIQQDNQFGDEPVPGALNRPLYARPTYSENSAAFNRIAPTAVGWLEASLQVTEQTSLRVAMSTVIANNVLLAEESVIYSLPDMGLRNPGDQQFIQQFFYCGIEMVR